MGIAHETAKRVTSAKKTQARRAKNTEKAMDKMDSFSGGGGYGGLANSKANNPKAQIRRSQKR